MDQSLRDSTVSSGHHDDNGAAGSATRKNRELSHEMFPLKTLPGQAPRPTTRRGDSSSTMNSPSASPALSDSSLDRQQTGIFLLPKTDDGRPKWFSETSRRNKRRLNSVLQIPWLAFLVRWMKGPSPPRPYSIVPIFPKLQAWPSSTLSKYLSKTQGNALVACFACFIWLVAFSVTMANSSRSIAVNKGAQTPVRLDCISRLWTVASECGVDGKLCQPFEGASFPFICPSDCAAVQVLEPYTIGDQEVIYRNLVIGPSNYTGGRSAYRGDSFICPAAIHAGITSNQLGGCGILNREGTEQNFSSIERNGISSISFEPSFPLSFSLSPSSGDCHDPQWSLFSISVFATVIISLTATPPALFFSSIFVIAFFQVALASDSPYFPDYASVISLAFERFLPAAFVAAVLYRYCVRYTLTGLKAYWERTLLWLSGCWVGALNVYTFDRIPISRLTPHDLRQQPGAIVALLVILVIIAVAAIGQIWAFRIEGRLLRYVGLYLFLGLMIGCFIAIPGLDLRIHHYIIGLLLLPGTSLQTRPSLLYQGILMGLFINGIARWGFASILQTPAALLEGGQLGSPLPTNLIPQILSNTITFTIQQLADGFDGVSILVNDVERFQATNMSLPTTFNWTRVVPDETLFFRFAFTGTYTLGGIWYGDYTKPGTWFGNGTWKDMLPGPSR